MAIHPTLRGTIARLADRISPPSPPPAGGWVNELPEAFAALHADGSIMCIGYQGQWYWTRKPSWRVRIHNWLVGLCNQDDTYPRNDRGTTVHISDFHWHTDG